jgi:hypothetical protein
VFGPLSARRQADYNVYTRGTISRSSPSLVLKHQRRNAHGQKQRLVAFGCFFTDLVPPPRFCCTVPDSISSIAKPLPQNSIRAQPLCAPRAGNRWTPAQSASHPVFQAMAETGRYRLICPWKTVPVLEVLQAQRFYMPQITLSLVQQYFLAL